jgi:hypothetical protein
VQSDGTDAPVGGGGGGGPAFVGSVMILSSSQFGYVSGAVIAFDTAIFDSDGFADIANNKFVVPAGKAGWYRVGHVLNLTDFDLATQTLQNPRLDTSGNPDNLNGVYSTFQALGGEGICAGVIGPLAEGDDLRAKVFWSGGGTARVLATGSQFSCEYLGP